MQADDLGMLVNRVNHCDKVEPWSFGVADLMKNLAARGLALRSAHLIPRLLPEAEKVRCAGA